MKSEKARKLIDVAKLPGEYDYWYVDEKVVIEAVELAEKEAEERMRAKAIKAYCSECSCYETGVCALDPDKCVTYLLFIEKLTEK